MALNQTTAASSSLSSSSAQLSTTSTADAEEPESSKTKVVPLSKRRVSIARDIRASAEARADFSERKLAYNPNNDPAAEVGADFSPVYRCLHIYRIMNCADEFVMYYKEQRRLQSILIADPLSLVSPPQTTTEKQQSTVDKPRLLDTVRRCGCEWWFRICMYVCMYVCVCVCVCV